ncbi:hypothetical protein [Bacillus paranthracis]|uniref:hypothetical protein n=1 Tax=Bacillus paranthracis TaxID=2026186 RepID=UPI0021FE9510|nr:hypothetical protein [Bacillus paranthracis]UXR28781.1 membrane protein [Bacillus phage Nachito]
MRKDEKEYLKKEIEEWDKTAKVIPPDDRPRLILTNVEKDQLNVPRTMMALSIFAMLLSGLFLIIFREQYVGGVILLIVTTIASGLLYDQDSHEKKQLREHQKEMQKLIDRR